MDTRHTYRFGRWVELFDWSVQGPPTVIINRYLPDIDCYEIRRPVSGVAIVKAKNLIELSA